MDSITYEILQTQKMHISVSDGKHGSVLQFTLCIISKDGCKDKAVIMQSEMAAHSNNGCFSWVC